MATKKILAKKSTTVKKAPKARAAKKTTKKVVAKAKSPKKTTTPKKSVKKVTAKKKAPVAKKSTKKVLKKKAPVSKKATPKAKKKAVQPLEDRLAKEALKFIDDASKLLRLGIKTANKTTSKARTNTHKKAHTLLGKATRHLDNVLSESTSMVRKAIKKI